LRIVMNQQVIFEQSIISLHRKWAETSYRMQAMRDNADCARQEYDRLLDAQDPGLHFNLTYAPLPTQVFSTRPMVAILREQGVNGHVEMAAAFHRAGFTPVDVHMSDLLSQRTSLSQFKGVVACGGFSYGDVLGAGAGWAHSILSHPHARREFQQFFHRPDTFALGVCNGCQMMSRLKELIPGAENWPRFVRNASDQFEARVCMVTIPESPAASVWFTDMVGSRIPIAVAHGEGRAEFTDVAGVVAMQYTDNKGAITESFPSNPNGSPIGITGLSSSDGRVLIMMPHPERVVRTVAQSWYPRDVNTGLPTWGELDSYADGPWLRMFQNVRRWVA
jgi:phosphoribosylformylglycinamidine synthase